MSRACCGDTGGQTIRREATSFRATEVLALAASPTFALMALLTGVLSNDPADALCSTMHASPLNGMTMMYLLMSAFHVAPWVRLMRAQR